MDPTCGVGFSFKKESTLPVSSKGSLAPLNVYASLHVSQPPKEKTSRETYLLLLGFTEHPYYRSAYHGRHRPANHRHDINDRSSLVTSANPD